MWIQTDHFFEDRRKVFTIGHRSGASRILQDSLRRLESEPSVLEAVLRQLVITARPELKGCVILAMHFKIESWQWEIAVSHEALPLVAAGCCSEREPLEIEVEEVSQL